MKVYRKLIIEDGYVLDPFIEEEKWIYRRNTSVYFLEEYNLTLSQVWNIVNEFDKDFIHRCPICNKPLSFRSLSRGFYKACNQSHSMIHKFKDPEYLEYMTDILNSVESQARGRYTQFMDQGNPDDRCDFYLGDSIEFPGWIKFGITEDIESRGHYFSSNLNNIHSIKSGTREYVASLERDLKIHLNQIDEYIKSDKIDILVNFVNNYKLD